MSEHVSSVEIERKFLLSSLPEDLGDFPFHKIEQGYLNLRPAVRVRKEDDDFYLTYKGAAVGEHGKTEYNLPLDEASYQRLLKKAEGRILQKTRYILPINENAYTEEEWESIAGLSEALDEGRLCIELDVFEGVFDKFVLAEVEFPSEEAAAAYRLPDWFLCEVTGDRRYTNAEMTGVSTEGEALLPYRYSVKYFE